MIGFSGENEDNYNSDDNSDDNGNENYDDDGDLDSDDGCWVPLITPNTQSLLRAIFLFSTSLSSSSFTKVS